MRLAAGFGAFLLMSGAAMADPIEDSQVLYDALVQHVSPLASAIQAPVSRELARSLETELYQPIQAALQEWDRARFQSGSFRSYSEFEPCLSAGQLLGYVADEVIQHHLGNDPFEGSMKYRHYEPFIERIEKCDAQISAARAERAQNGSDS